MWNIRFLTMLLKPNQKNYLRKSWWVCNEWGFSIATATVYAFMHIITVFSFAFIVILICFLKDMNEPASFVHGTVGENCLGDPNLENPPYMPRKFQWMRPDVYTWLERFYNTDGQPVLSTVHLKLICILLILIPSTGVHAKRSEP